MFVCTLNLIGVIDGIFFQDEVVAMLFEINKKPGKPQNPVRLLNRHIHNVICQLIMSFRFSDEDTRFKTLTRKMKQVKKLFSSIYIGEYLPYYMVRL